MPETTVDKNGDSLVPEHEIRFTEDRLSAPPARYAVCPKEGNHPELGVLVAASADARHDSTTLFRSEDIRHRERLGN
jgi:hypothetical protein